ncbi:MAG: hypothetical protein IPH62_13390 [Ignavibacteriae bacterium]|nr:hypothetical protein [Ignavibacteriota bacterium]
MKKILLIIFIVATIVVAQKNKLDFKDYPISNVDIRNIKLTDNFWLPKIKTVQNTTINMEVWFPKSLHKL